MTRVTYRQKQVPSIGLFSRSGDIVLVWQMREQRYAHINDIKIKNQWRKIRRMTKVEDLKRSVEILAQNHERDVDRKDAIVQVTRSYARASRVERVRSSTET